MSPTKKKHNMDYIVTPVSQTSLTQVIESEEGKENSLCTCRSRSDAMRIATAMREKHSRDSTGSMLKKLFGKFVKK